MASSCPRVEQRACFRRMVILFMEFNTTALDIIAGALDLDNTPAVLDFVDKIHTSRNCILHLNVLRDPTNILKLMDHFRPSRLSDARATPKSCFTRYRRPYALCQTPTHCPSIHVSPIAPPHAPAPQTPSTCVAPDGKDSFRQIVMHFMNFNLAALDAISPSINLDDHSAVSAFVDDVLNARDCILHLNVLRDLKNILPLLDHLRSYFTPTSVSIPSPPHIQLMHSHRQIPASNLPHLVEHQGSPHVTPNNIEAHIPDTSLSPFARNCAQLGTPEAPIYIDSSPEPEPVSFKKTSFPRRKNMEKSPLKKALTREQRLVPTFARKPTRDEIVSTDEASSSMHDFLYQRDTTPKSALCAMRENVSLPDRECPTPPNASLRIHCPIAPPEASSPVEREVSPHSTESPKVDSSSQEQERAASVKPCLPVKSEDNQLSSTETPSPVRTIPRKEDNLSAQEQTTSLPSPGTRVQARKTQPMKYEPMVDPPINSDEHMHELGEHAQATDASTANPRIETAEIPEPESRKDLTVKAQEATTEDLADSMIEPRSEPVSDLTTKPKPNPTSVAMGIVEPDMNADVSACHALDKRSRRSSSRDKSGKPDADVVANVKKAKPSSDTLSRPLRRSARVRNHIHPPTQVDEASASKTARSGDDMIDGSSAPRPSVPARLRNQVPTLTSEGDKKVRKIERTVLKKASLSIRKYPSRCANAAKTCLLDEENNVRAKPEGMALYTRRMSSEGTPTPSSSRRTNNVRKASTAVASASDDDESGEKCLTTSESKSCASRTARVKQSQMIGGCSSTQSLKRGKIGGAVDVDKASAPSYKRARTSGADVNSNDESPLSNKGVTPMVREQTENASSSVTKQDVDGMYKIVPDVCGPNTRRKGMTSVKTYKSSTGNARRVNGTLSTLAGTISRQKRGTDTNTTDTPGSRLRRRSPRYMTALAGTKRQRLDMSSTVQEMLHVAHGSEHGLHGCEQDLEVAGLFYNAAVCKAFEDTDVDRTVVDEVVRVLRVGAPGVEANPRRANALRDRWLEK